MLKLLDVCSYAMNHYVSLSLTNRKSSVHVHALYSLRTALRTFTPRRDRLVICGQYVVCLFVYLFIYVCTQLCTKNKTDSGPYCCEYEWGGRTKLQIDSCIATTFGSVVPPPPPLPYL
jgi:hypothetical protein